MPKRPTVSIVIPVVNGGRYISNTISQLRTLEGDPHFFVEFIVVDDGSSDDTVSQVSRITSGLSSWHLIQNSQNMGKGFSVKKGMLSAYGDFLLFADSDLSYPIASLRAVIDSLFKGHAVVVVSRVGDGAVLEVPSEMFGYFYTRHTMSRLLNMIVQGLIVKEVTDTQSGLKGFTREAALDIFPKQTLNRFSFDLEVLFIARKQGYKLTELPVRSRYFSEPSTVSFIRDGVDVLRSLFVIRWRDFRGQYGKSK